MTAVLSMPGAHCEHLDRDDVPAHLQPLALALHRGRVECSTCFLASCRDDRGSVEDHRCDVCGHCFDTLVTLTVAAHRIAVFAGVCSGCRAVAFGAGGPR